MIRFNKQKKLISSVILLFLFVLGGCSARVADLTLVSTKNIDFSDLSLDARKGQRHQGEDCKFNLLGLIPFGLPSMEEAVDRALEQGNGNVLVDEVTEIKGYWVVIGAVSCISVEGTVLNAPTGTD